MSNRRRLKLRLFAATLAAAACAALAHSGHSAAPSPAGDRQSAARKRPAPQEPARAPHVAGELLVRFDKRAARASASAAHARAGARVVAELDGGWQHLKLPETLSVEAALALYAAAPGVAGAQPNYVYRISDTAPNDALYGQLYGMAKISAPAAWDLSTGSPTVVVAVLDTGARHTHEDLEANVWTNPGETGPDAQGNDKATNGVDDDASGFPDDVRGWDFANGDADPADDNGHGTHVCGTVGAAGHNAKGVAGVNWSVSLLVVKTHDAAGNSTSAKVVAAFDYVRALRARGVNVRVTNNSWGGAPEAPAYDPALEEALRAAGEAGILNVFAAGNGNANTDTQPFYPAAYNVPNLVSVAASDQNDNRAAFSNYGATSVDLAAPGVGILSTGRADPGNTYVSLNGTSMAAPHVAGAAALLAAHNPALGAASLKATLLNTVDVLPQWSAAGQTPAKALTGGRLNVGRALGTPTGCAYTLGASGAGFSAAGGGGSLDVQAQPNCDWSAKSDASWITITSAPHAGGDGTVTFTVAPTDGPARAGTVTAAGQTFTVTQTSGCAYSVSPATLPQFPAAGGQGSFQMLTGAGCVWNASALSPWITITQGASGTGPGAVSFSVAPNLEAGPRLGLILRTNDSFFNVSQAAPKPAPGDVIISEFRIDGPRGPADEFYELYNATDEPVTVSAPDGSAGWSLAAFYTTGGAHFTQFACTVPNGAVIPARGHYLCANNSTDNSGNPRGYSLADYGGQNRAAPDRATNGAGVSADGTNTVLTGLALFRSTLSFTNDSRLDAVGTAPVGLQLAAEGQPINYRGEYATAAQYSWVRRTRGGVPQDTGDSAADFQLVSTTGATLGGVPSVLGAPGPENTASPVRRDAGFASAPVDPKCVDFAPSAGTCQNRVRDASAPGAAHGTLTLRRRYRNETGAVVTRLRFRVVEMTTLRAANAAGADLRALSSPDVTITTAAGRPLAVKGTTLEAPPAQASGGGLNSTLSVELPAGGLAPGASIDVQFLLGVERPGKYRFVVSVEAQ